MTATREQAYSALKALNEKISTLKCGSAINAATRTHEVDNGYSKLDTANDAVKPLASMVYFLRHEAAAVCIPQGTYQWAVDTCERAAIWITAIELIESRA